jgi:acetylornithine deacetylase/succinyl-diaminopimelate desuccinylase-like protein
MNDPWSGELRDGMVWGRGATDMKGGLAAAMWAVKVALEQGLEPRGDIVFHVVSDEEVVGNGTREIVERVPKRPKRPECEDADRLGGAAEGLAQVDARQAHG